MKKLLLVALLLVGITGCAAMFGEMVQVKDGNGIPLVNPDGSPVMAYKDGAVQKLAKTLAPIAGLVPYGGAGAALLGIIGTIGAGVQTVRHKRRVDPDDVRAMVDDLGPEIKKALGDKDLGDLVANWNPDSDTAKKIKRAFERHREKNGAKTI